jgi:hypothetical protein
MNEKTVYILQDKSNIKELIRFRMLPSKIFCHLPDFSSHKMQMSVI